MGIGRVVVEAIVREHQYKPITGDVLMIGRQTVYLTPVHLIQLLKENGLETNQLRPEAMEIDRSTIDRRPGVASENLVSDRCVFHTLSESTRSPPPVVDVSPYEGAEIIHNLNYPVPERLKGIADFIVDGSTLDNTFSGALTLVNYCEMLRPGGRLLAVNAFSPHNTPYAIMPPQTFLDYFVANRFADCKAYILVYDDDPQAGRLNVLHLDLPYIERQQRLMSRFVSSKQMMSLIFAEKGSNSTTQEIPIQQDYRSPEEWTQYLSNLAVMRASPRPHLARSTADLFVEPRGGNILVNGRYESAWS